MASGRTVLFVSTMDGQPWGASEELWAQSALSLVAQGIPVAASVVGWSPLHPRVLDLRARGVDLQIRPPWLAPKRLLWQRLVS
jgi:hypothetical protein